MVLLPTLAISLSLLSQERPDRLVDDSKNHWVYVALADLYRQGLLPEYPYGIFDGGPRAFPRSSIAAMTRAACARLHEVMEDALRQNGKVAQYTSGSSASRAEVQEWAENLSGELAEWRKSSERTRRKLKALTLFFAPQLRDIRVDPGALASAAERDLFQLDRLQTVEVGEATRPFSDVPHGHWAASATLNLRREGILHGYPGKRFGSR